MAVKLLYLCTNLKGLHPADFLRLDFQAKLRGMSIPEFLDYTRQEKQYCEEMCAKCKEVPLPPGCEQETVDKYCGR